MSTSRFAAAMFSAALLLVYTAKTPASVMFFDDFEGLPTGETAYYNPGSGPAPVADIGSWTTTFAGGQAANVSVKNYNGSGNTQTSTSADYMRDAYAGAQSLQMFETSSAVTANTVGSFSPAETVLVSAYLLSFAGTAGAPFTDGYRTDTHITGFDGTSRVFDIRLIYNPSGPIGPEVRTINNSFTEAATALTLLVSGSTGGVTPTKTTFWQHLEVFANYATQQYELKLDGVSAGSFAFPDGGSLINLTSVKFATAPATRVNLDNVLIQVPEPATVALVSAAGVLLLRRRRA